MGEQLVHAIGIGIVQNCEDSKHNAKDGRHADAKTDKNVFVDKVPEFGAGEEQGIPVDQGQIDGGQREDGDLQENKLKLEFCTDAGLL